MLVQEAVVDDDVRWLELIDDLHRLGISCHFENQIIQILNSTYLDYKYETEQRDLYSTSLRFRLLRQYGFSISQGAKTIYLIQDLKDDDLVVDQEK